MSNRLDYIDHRAYIGLQSGRDRVHIPSPENIVNKPCIIAFIYIKKNNVNACAK